LNISLSELLLEIKSKSLIKNKNRNKLRQHWQEESISERKAEEMKLNWRDLKDLIPAIEKINGEPIETKKNYFSQNFILVQ